MRFRARRFAPACLSIALVCLALAAPAAFAQTTEVSGQTETGAFYSFVVPDFWQPSDGLVIWNHGFDLSPIAPNPDLGPLADVHLSQGYALAASSYSQTGWALFNVVADLEQMVAAFVQQFGTPEHVYVYGASLGGAVTATAIEQAELGNVVGAYPFCGAVAGSRVWDGAVDLRLIYDAICGDVPGAEIPGGAAGLPFPVTFTEEALGLALQACFGLLVPEFRTDDQQERLDQILAVTALPENFLATDLGFATFGMADLIYDPGKLGGRQPFTTIGVDYGDEEVNDAIARIEADSSARRDLFDNYTPTGDVGDVKIVSIHTDKDGLVLVENEAEYAEVVPEDQLLVGIVVEDVPTHCEFSSAELVAGWETLRTWVALDSPKPAVDAMQATCLGLEAAALADGPCRFDADFVVPSIDGRVRPRQGVCLPDEATLCLNGSRFAVTVQWRDFEGNTGAGRAVEQTSETGAFWFFSETNLELLIKVLDGRSENGNWWVFLGALSNVEYTVTVTDTVTGEQQIYFNPIGEFASFGDTMAF
ncbi:MAG: hypothetical protein AAGN46_03325 [Acidobacteriota bacterium]